MLKNLAKLNVIITRPKDQAISLMQKINAQQGHAVLFPTLEIIPLNDGATASSFLSINEFDYLIFTSVNAVRGAKEVLPHFQRPIVVAMGPSTALALQQLHCTVDYIPPEPFDSEHLLALPEFAQITDKRILIVTGQGGRGLLEKDLTLKGAKVTVCPVYKRQAPIVTQEQIDTITRLPNCVLVTTSCEGLANLIAILQRNHFAWLQRTPVLIISKRMREFALREGLQDPYLILSPNATEDAILDSLIKWYSYRSNANHCI